jgi:hypothetical protein
MKSRFNRLKYYGVRLGVVLASVYIGLFLAEIVLWRMEPKQYLYEMHRGLHRVKDGRAVLNPGYYDRFDDGIAHGEIRVNSFGYRGHEPSPDPKRRVLLLGDSFAFGALLDQKETMDARMEEKEPGLEVDNLGVIGYNLPEQLARLREWTLPANQVVYLFYPNDFRLPVELTIVDGFPVPRKRRDGSMLSDDDQLRRVKSKEKQAAESHALSPMSSLRLPRFRRLIRNAYQRFRNRHSDVSIDLWPGDEDYSKSVPRSLDSTLEMRDLAVSRNMGFQVAIIPGVEELRDGKHLSLVMEYIAGLKAAGISVIDLFPKLSTADYWSYDPHFNSKGAKIAADEIYKALQGNNSQIQ